MQFLFDNNDFCFVYVNTLSPFGSGLRGQLKEKWETKNRLRFLSFACKYVVYKCTLNKPKPTFEAFRNIFTKLISMYK